MVPHPEDPLFRRWDEVDRIFQEILDLEPVERIPYLHEVCGGDEELFGLVEELLHSLDPASRLLEDRTLILSAQDSLIEEEAEVGGTECGGEEIGRQVGAYRLIREIGRGGTGTVYLAERADGAFDQRVAIKLLRRGLDTDDLLARFRAERQILASLDHPNIARLLDGGATDDGRPYLVMELVEGTPITTYCEAARLTIEERLELFITVILAVGYAHRNLIVHRDLKPSNILVREDGRVKLLDFGIAKLLDAPESGDSSPLTRTGVRLLTPEFASPEQVLGEPVTTASDIYQLGVLLSVLIAGARPFPTSRRRPLELERAIRDELPRAPSTIVDDEFAATCRSDARRLSRQLRGDLDTIVLAALRREPERRYSSAGEMAADIERHLTGLPLTARPDTWGYRTRKLIRRHPGRVAAIGAALLVVIGYILTLASHADNLRAERDRALIESAKVQEVSDFLMALFESSDPDHSAGEELTALDLVRRGEENAALLDDRPRIKAEMLGLIGGLYLRLGEFERAESLLQNALGLLRGTEISPSASGTVGLESSEMVRVMDRLGTVLRIRGRWADAESTLREALDLAERIGDPDLEAEVNSTLGFFMHNVGKHGSAEPYYQRAVELRRESPGSGQVKLAEVLHGLALTLHLTGRIDEAEPTFTESLSLKRAALPPGHSSIATTLYALGRLYAWRQDYDAALPALREAVEINRARFGPNHPLIFEGLNEIGFTLMQQGDFAAAEETLREAIGIGYETIGPESRVLATSIANLSFVLAEEGQLMEAVRYRREAHGLRRRLPSEGGRGPATALSAYDLGILLERVGEHPAADSAFDEALGYLEVAYHGEVPLTNAQLGALGDLLLRAGRPAEAEPPLRFALERGLRSGIYKPGLADIESKLGAALMRLGEYEEAEGRLRKAYEALVEQSGADHSYTRAAHGRLLELEVLRGEGAR